MKRIFLFLLTNIAVMVVISIIVNLLGVNKYLTANGLNLPMLLIFSAVVGFSGAIISLLMSKQMAKWSTGLQIITTPQNANELWLINTVHNLATRAGISMPEVGIYEGEPNAFATGASKNNSLVAVSTGLMYSMTQKEVEGVLAHEVAHIANGDMVTLTLIQGVVNTFVVFLSRVVAYAADSFFKKEGEKGTTWVYPVASIVFEILFGILASTIVMYFSRIREYKADEGAAKIMQNKQPMILALKKLLHLQTGGLPSSMASCGIASDKSHNKSFSLAGLFMTHPPLESRIVELENMHPSKM
jgi:heat shock protein HtpX